MPQYTICEHATEADDIQMNAQNGYLDLELLV